MTERSPSRLNRVDALPAEVLRGIVGGAQGDDRQTVDSDTAIGLTVGPDAAGASATGPDTTGPELQNAPAAVDAEGGNHVDVAQVADQPLHSLQPEDASPVGIEATSTDQTEETPQQVEDSRPASSADWFEADEPKVVQASLEDLPKDLLESSHDPSQSTEDFETAQDDDTVDHDLLPLEDSGDTKAGWQFAETAPVDVEVGSHNGGDQLVERPSSNSQPEEAGSVGVEATNDNEGATPLPVDETPQPIPNEPDGEKTREAMIQHLLEMPENLSEPELQYVSRFLGALSEEQLQDLLDNPSNYLAGVAVLAERLSQGDDQFLNDSQEETPQPVGDHLQYAARFPNWSELEDSLKADESNPPEDLREFMRQFFPDSREPLESADDLPVAVPGAVGESSADWFFETFLKGNVPASTPGVADDIRLDNIRSALEKMKGTESDAKEHDDHPNENQVKDNDASKPQEDAQQAAARVASSLQDALTTAFSVLRGVGGLRGFVSEQSTMDTLAGSQNQDQDTSITAYVRFHTEIAHVKEAMTGWLYKNLDHYGTDLKDINKFLDRYISQESDQFTAEMKHWLDLRYRAGTDRSAAEQIVAAYKPVEIGLDDYIKAYKISRHL